MTRTARKLLLPRLWRAAASIDAQLDMSIGAAVGALLLRSDLFAGGRVVFRTHLLNDNSRSIPFHTFVRIPPDIVKHVSFSDMDNLSIVKGRNLGRFISEKPLNVVALPVDYLNPHPFVAATRCLEWRFKQNRFAGLQACIERLMQCRQLGLSFAACLQ